VGIMMFADYGKTLKIGHIAHADEGGVVYCEPSDSYTQKVQFIQDYAFPTGSQSIQEAHLTAFNIFHDRLQSRNSRAIILHYTRCATAFEDDFQEWQA